MKGVSFCLEEGHMGKRQDAALQTRKKDYRGYERTFR